MPATGLSYGRGPLRLSCSSTGWVTSVALAGEPDLSYLSGAVVASLQVDGVGWRPAAPEMLADLDEVEFVYTCAGRLRLVVRHTFGAGWGLRLAFSSLSDRPQVVEQIELRLSPAPGCLAWALTLGATGAYAVLPVSGAGPLLGAVLRRGSLDRATADGLELSRFELHRDTRYVCQLQWDWYDTPQTFRAERCVEAPSTLFLTAGESAQLRVDEDVAVVTPAGVETTQTSDQLDVVAPAAGIFPFELRSARGTTSFDLEWVDPVEEQLSELVSSALAGPRTAAGVVKLASVAEGLVVQHGLARGQVDDSDEAAESLDRFTARLGGATTKGTPPLTPLEAAFLCREYDRLGDADLLSLAWNALRAQPAAVPGLGMAATQLCLGLIVSGQPVQEVLSWLLRLARSLTAAGGVDHDPMVSARSAELELIAVTSAGPGAGGALGSAADVVPRIAELGVQLGAGLPGAAVGPLPVSDLSHLIAVLQLLPDGVSAELVPHWGCSAHTLARRAIPELLARLRAESINDAHAWLVLSLQAS